MTKFTKEMVEAMGSDKAAETINSAIESASLYRELYNTACQQRDDWKRWYDELTEENDKNEKIIKIIKSAINNI